jgi:hypothetical protein
VWFSYGLPSGIHLVEAQAFYYVISMLSDLFFGLSSWDLAYDIVQS